MEYQIRTDDLPSAKELEPLFSQTSWASGRTREDIGEMIENLKVFVTIRKDSELIGFGRAITDGVYRALIDDIVVHDVHRNRGLGRLIMENLLKQLEGIEEIFLNTKPELEQFYKRFGFIRVNGLTMKRKK